MDRPIDIADQRRARLKGAAQAAAALALLVLLLLAVRALIRPSVAADDLRVATVEAGPMVASIDITGLIVPRSETVVPAPFGSELRAIAAPPGTALAADEPILELESRPLEAEISQLEEQVALKDNERRSKRLTVEQALRETRGRHALQAIDLESHEARLDRLSQLAEIGAISKGELLEAQLDVRRGQVELQQLVDELAHLEVSHQAELERIDLEASILASQLDEKRRLRQLATVRAPHAGVVTWVLEDLGASVAPGAPLARVADLSNFRVEASASDYYAERIVGGQRAVVRVGEREVGAQVAAVLPAVEQGTLRVVLDLDDPGMAGLRPNLRADILLEIDRAADTLSVRRGPGVQGRGQTPLFRLEGDLAVRVDARLGFSNRDRVQVLDGLAVGDRVVISSTDRFRHLESITVKN